MVCRNGWRMTTALVANDASVIGINLSADYM